MVHFITDSRRKRLFFIVFNFSRAKLISIRFRSNPFVIQKLDVNLADIMHISVGFIVAYILYQTIIIIMLNAYKLMKIYVFIMREAIRM